MSKRRNVFVSYHHGEPGKDGDLEYRDRLKDIFDANGDLLLWGAVPDNVIDRDLPEDEIRRQIRDDYLKDTSVTIVLVGAKTWQRRHVDWEIGASLRDTEFNPRSGLLGLLLPSYPGYPKSCDACTIPPRLYKNVKREYAKLYWWSEDPATIAGWVDEAYRRKSDILPDNSDPPFKKNHTGERWC